jgi:hypothetical protein
MSIRINLRYTGSTEHADLIHNRVQFCSFQEHAENFLFDYVLYRIRSNFVLIR